LRWLAAPLVGSLAGCGATPIYHTEPIPAFMRPDIGLTVHPPESPIYQSGYQEVKGGAAAASKRPSVVTLPEAIDEAITFNLRIRVGMEKVQAARADLTTASIIPNPTLQLDAQFVPLPGAHPYEQNKQSAGPLQYDLLVTFPIDWFIFGKRRAAMEAARLGVDVAAADFADLTRKQVAATLDAVYDILEARALLKLFQEDLDELKQILKITEERVKLGGGAAVDLDRLRLAVLDAQREVRRRELTLFAAKSKLRPLLGRLEADPAFDISGELGIQGTMPAPELGDAISVAERNRPDIISDLRDIRRAEAAVVSEHKKAWPQVGFQPALTYQQTKFINDTPSERFLDFYLTTTLPTSDRNQGGIAKAMSDLRNKHMTLQADLTDLHAEVEQALETYRVALATITADDPATIKSAREFRDRIRAAWLEKGKTLLDVLDAQRAYRERVRASLSGQADYWRALNRLNAAMGVRLSAEPELLPEPKPVDEKELKKQP
jgi:cobalt-zinc-cadmium efflux system outer membrane protein